MNNNNNNNVANNAEEGRYWNYEMERWSFCNSDDDEDRAEEIKHMNNNNNNNVANNAEENGEDDEWEYYYDDVDLKPKEQPNEETIVKEEEPNPAPAPQPLDQQQQRGTNSSSSTTA